MTGFALLATAWALWLVRDRPAVAVTLVLVCAVVLVMGLRKKPQAAVGTLQVDDLGRVFWNGAVMRARQWQRAERSVWIRLEPDFNGAAASVQRSSAPVDVFAAASMTTSEDWAALQRWLVWLERGSGPNSDR